MMKQFLTVTKRERLFLVVGTVAIGIVLFVLFVIQPTEARIRDLKVQLTEQETLAASGRSAQDRYKQNLEELKTAQDQLSALQAPVPTEKEVGEFVVYLADAERTSGAEVQSLLFPTGQQLQAFTQYPVNAQLEGGFPQLVAFLRTIEDFKRIVRVQTFKAMPADTGYGIVNSEFTLFIYSRMSGPPSPQEEAVFQVPAGRTNPFIPTR